MDRWALISVFDKSGIAEFARTISCHGWQILASGGTAKTISLADVKVRDVADLVGGGAILDHRVVTLSREIHAGLLADPANPKHAAEMEQLGLPFIDMVVCDFYPLARAIAEPGATTKSVVELTDIGGPAMVRSAAKGGRVVLCRRSDWSIVLEDLIPGNGEVSQGTRQYLRAVAEFVVAQYCAASAAFHSNGGLQGTFVSSARFSGK
jgi:phosphoribosylaminoimidazolecarboxamide formyltransferase/IMP cyclohydrolase